MPSQHFLVIFMIIEDSKIIIIISKYCIGIGTSGTQGANAPSPNIGKDSTDINGPINSCLFHSMLILIYKSVHKRRYLVYCCHSNWYATMYYSTNINF